MLTEKNIIVIGDVHGRTSWKQIVDKHPGCRLVFLGDYCDPYEKIPGEAVLENLMEIIRLKQAHPDDVILLLGNHDVHYYCDEAPIGTRYNLELGWEIEERFTMFAECFQCAYKRRIQQLNPLQKHFIAEIGKGENPAFVGLGQQLQ